MAGRADGGASEDAKSEPGVSVKATWMDGRDDDRVRALVANLPGAAVFVVDHDLRYRLADGEALHAAGFTPASFVGKTLEEAVEPALTAEYAANYRKALRGEPFTVEHATYGRVYLTRGTPLYDTEGRVEAALVVSYDITDQRRVEAALRASEEATRAQLAQLEAIYASAPVGLAILDRDLRFMRINDRLAEINGVPAAEHFGRTVREVVPDIAEAAEAALRRVLDTGQAVRDLELVGETPAQPGVVRTWIEQWLPVRDREGRVIGVSVVADEITALRAAMTEREQLLADAQTARAAAEAASRAKSEFLAMMSHELRTPLNAIAGYAELMELGIHGPVTAEQLNALARIQQSQRHLLGLINGVLNYSRLEAGAVRYAMVDLSLNEALATCEALVAPQARARGVALTYQGCDPSLGVHADQEKLQQIVLNLLSNAVKFTESGGSVTLSCAAAGDMVQVRVADTGRGIHADQLERIFQPFVQVDVKLTRTQEGTGLGLTISRDLARGMGGDLTAESELGVGSTFVLSLPAVR